MENYVGKICPFCKTEIKEGDAVKVCPACDIPHHEDCWKENKGCTTFGCSEQYHEEQGTNPTEVCSNCGATLGDGQAFCTKCGTPKNAPKKNICSKCGNELQDGQGFCPKCGTPKNAPQKNICGKCGNELQEGQEFCPKCGQKAGLVVDQTVTNAINNINAGISKSNEAKKNMPKKIISVLVAVVALILVLKVVAPKIFVSVDDLCAQGNYEKAYAKADDDEKLAIRAENIAAVQSANSAENLKDPNSFNLREAYYDELTNADGEPIKRLVLYLSGANSYGANVSSYWLYTWNSDDKEWEYYCSVSDLSDEEISSYDDEDERLEKAVNNIGRIFIKTTLDDGYKLSKDAINRINDLFEADKLDDVKILKED
ncbi:MAG: zinc-ribbon domain-containing protein [Acutalibacteraceae bacterium]|nr:zinc-ribbon domain-containing protein [Acutalibacteraceae bacterium]